MGDKEFNELSKDDLEQVAGGAQPPSSYYRMVHCEVRLFAGPQYDYGVVISGNLPIYSGDLISVPAFNFEGGVTGDKPGASQWDNAVIIYQKQFKDGGVKIRTTDVYLI